MQCPRPDERNSVFSQPHASNRHTNRPHRSSPVARVRTGISQVAPAGQPTRARHAGRAGAMAKYRDFSKPDGLMKDWELTGCFGGHTQSGEPLVQMSNSDSGIAVRWARPPEIASKLAPVR